MGRSWFLGEGVLLFQDCLSVNPATLEEKREKKSRFYSTCVMHVSFDRDTTLLLRYRYVTMQRHAFDWHDLYERGLIYISWTDVGLIGRIRPQSKTNVTQIRHSCLFRDQNANVRNSYWVNALFKWSVQSQPEKTVFLYDSNWEWKQT